MIFSELPIWEDVCHMSPNCWVSFLQVFWDGLLCLLVPMIALSMLHIVAVFLHESEDFCTVPSTCFFRTGIFCLIGEVFSV